MILIGCNIKDYWIANYSSAKYIEYEEDKEETGN